MKKKKYTLHLLSESRDKPMILTFSNASARAVIIGVSIFLALLIVTILITLPKAVKFRQVNLENAQLVQDRLKVSQILSDYNQIRQMDQYIRSVLGTDLILTSGDSASNLTADYLKSNSDRSRFVQISFLENIPISPPVTGYITRGFIDDKVMTSENHYGVDVVAPEGTPIKAAAAGVVVFSNWTNDLGYMVILYHSNGYFSIYGHNQRNSVAEHQYVRRGEVIGYLGNTGKSEGPHLHLEIWREGNPIDPQDLIYSYKKADISLKNEGSN
ncbi:MAG: M23 family metallopeptidase [Candidatus Marinimicrobia bacterium]|nr:M23 family metallopeptidase [Candidatus Neomarinimicrobiota bacterium]MCK9483080.1 M23 family metallopeptidase [Candidatus Neomarinimicrobiota bacterium]MCK9559233.1 M23 family metallopeptidase [Candidatus Neomarinimicrobiota bacterium]MDD5061270.1 M23 family metallopeptidase [Candidatus Neomarinimicrobiota bacterium]MDD5230107.1 M23 family metallopeptidase [Candidatus Neomarinimicrobiota bacterium]